MSDFAEIKVLLPRHKAMLRLMVRGYTLKDAGNQLGYTPERARDIADSKIFQDTLKREEGNVDEKVIESVIEVKDDIKRNATAAVKVLAESLKAESEHIRIRAAQDILDRAGVAKEEKLRVDALVEPSQALVEMLARAIREGKVEQPKPDGHSGSEEVNAESV